MTGSKRKERARVQPATPEPYGAGAGERLFHGLGVSAGIAIGRAFVREGGDLPRIEYSLATQQDIDAETARFERAVRRAEKQLGRLRIKAHALHGVAAEELGYLLEAHSQMLASRRLLEGVSRRIREERRNAEAAVRGEIDLIAAGFDAMDDPYFRARGEEIREVGLRLTRALLDKPFSGFSEAEAGSIILSEEVTPADTALMDPARVAGFASVLGGAEGHTGIMARSLGIPAVLGVAGLLGTARNGEAVIVDGSRGVVILNPSEARLADYRARLTAIDRERRQLESLRDLPAVTRDGLRITLQANIELPREVTHALAAGAEGVGLLRSEFVFMNREDLPDEEEQFALLREIVEGMEGRTVTLRTLDLGGEKLATSLGAQLGESTNPALGLRAIRLSLRERPLLETQFAAMLRAAAYGPVRILLPMISGAGELREARRVYLQVAERLRKARLRIPDPLPPLGVMIEVPGAALSADSLAQSADFFAIGTNDLTMYTLAIDRAEERVAYLYNPLHPAVLRLIQFSVEAARRVGIPVSVCGEMAGEPRFTPLLLGLGVRELSMTASALPRVKQRIRRLDMLAAQRRAAAIMEQHDSVRIAAMLDDFNG